MSVSERSSAADEESLRRRTRRGFIQAVLVAIGAMAVVGLAWVIGRGGQSAGRDPEFTPPALLQPRTAPTAMSVAALEWLRGVERA